MRITEWPQRLGKRTKVSKKNIDDLTITCKKDIRDHTVNKTHFQRENW
jgi:hypothetical protein